MLKKLLINVAFALFSFFLVSSSTLAHVTVKPNEVGIGKFQTFTIGVPVEKDMATIGLRLVMPEGLNHVSPNLKPGWNIELKKSGSGEETKVTEISWTGGNIPQGFRDEFAFSAQVPNEETTLAWKAYQTYADGSVVAWEQEPKNTEHSEDFSKSGPYSETKIVDDLAIKSLEEKEKNKLNNFYLLSMAAFMISITTLVIQFKRKK